MICPFLGDMEFIFFNASFGSMKFNDSKDLKDIKDPQ